MHQEKKRPPKKPIVADIRESTEKTDDIDVLRKSEAKYRGFIENLSVMFYAAEPRPPYAPIYISPAFEQFGYPLEEWRDRLDLWMRVLHADDRDWVLKKTEAAMRAGEEIDYEYRMTAKNGNVHWVRDRGSFVRDERGDVICWQGIILDISERKQAEEALKESERRYRQMFEKNRAIKLLIDADTGAIMDANSAACEFYEYTSAELITKNITDLNTLPAEQVITELKRAKTEQRNYFLFRHRLASGEVRDVEVHSSPLQDQNRNLLYSIIRDITERKQTEQALRESEASYRDLFENANDLIYTHDLKGNFTSLNRAGEIITGFSREEALTINIEQVIAPDYLEKARAMIHRKVVGEAPTTYELIIVAKQGHRVSLELSTRLIMQDGEPIGVQGVGRDITERKRTEEALKESEARYRSLGEGIMHQVWTAQPDGKLDYVNNRTLEYFGRTSEQMLGEGWQAVVHPDDLPECLKRWTYSLETGKDYHAEFRLRRHDGEYLWYKARATAGLDADGEVVNWYGTSTDINDKKIAEAKLSHNALHDALTNLPNRIKFMNHLERAVTRSECNRAFRFAVLFLDLDRFKIINDSLGHTIGDKLLISIAERLESCVRPGDVVARLGGDEFTVLLSNINESADAVRVAKRLLEKLSAPFNLDSYEVFTSASIGIIISDEVRRQPEDFLRDADTAMYRAKEAGKSRYEIFDREMHIRNMKLLQLENDLRRAIEQNEFRVFYQPIVELETGEISEFEALIRWQHPQHGLVLPDEFICIAEETGLIVPIGKWILEESCRQTAAWQKSFPARNLSVSVNLSAKQLMHPNLTAQIGEILAKTELNPRSLKLEATESMVMGNSDRALSVISDLKNLGISVSTDDFGTGYSSLSYLHRFPFDRLKIDRSFVGKMDSDVKSEAIVRTILLLGQNLNIETVAEGIETDAQLAGLRELGCQTGQGFLFSKPVDAASAAQLLRDGLPNDYRPAPFSYGETVGREVVEVDKIQ